MNKYEELLPITKENLVHAEKAIDHLETHFRMYPRDFHIRYLNPLRWLVEATKKELE